MTQDDHIFAETWKNQVEHKAQHPRVFVPLRGGSEALGPSKNNHLSRAATEAAKAFALSGGTKHARHEPDRASDPAEGDDTKGGMSFGISQAAKSK